MKSYAMKVVADLKRHGNFADANLGVADVIQLLRDDEAEINRLARRNIKLRRDLESVDSYRFPDFDGWRKYAEQACSNWDVETAKRCFILELMERKRTEADAFRLVEARIRYIAKIRELNKRIRELENAAKRRGKKVR